MSRIYTDQHHSSTNSVGLAGEHNQLGLAFTRPINEQSAETNDLHTTNYSIQTQELKQAHTWYVGMLQHTTYSAGQHIHGCMK